MGASAMEIRNKVVAASTVKGPVGRLLPLALTKVPASPLRAPNSPDRITIFPSFSVQYLAETAGVINRAAISTMPTA
ncbi:hypothetical protein D3C72_2174000 [compost metagenome]